MSFVTLDMKEFKDRWMKLYVNLNLVMSRNPKEMEVLRAFKDKLAVYNEEFMGFFDAMENIGKGDRHE